VANAKSEMLKSFNKLQQNTALPVWNHSGPESPRLVAQEYIHSY